MKQLAYALLVIAVLLLVAAGLPRRRPLWPLAQGALDFRLASRLTLLFTPELDMPHMVEVEFPRTPQSEALLELMRSDSPPVELSWEVHTSQGVQHGSTGTLTSQFGASTTVGLITGGFLVPPGSSARLVLTVTRANYSLPSSRFVVRVIPHPGLAKSLFVTLALKTLLRTIGLVVLAIAIIILLIALAARPRAERLAQ